MFYDKIRKGMSCGNVCCYWALLTETLKIAIYKTILPMFCMCEKLVSYLQEREMLRKVFGYKRNDVSQRCRLLNREKLRDFVQITSYC